MNRIAAATAVLVAAINLLGATGRAAAQIASTQAVEWPAGPTSPGGLAPRLSQSATPTPLMQPTVQSTPRLSENQWFAARVLFTSMASVAGLYGGAYLGINSTDEYGGGWAEEAFAAYLGAAVGSNLGAITTAGLLNGRWGWTILGSLGGMAAGTLVGVAVGEGGGNGAAAIALYGLTHGLITTAAGGR